MASTTEKIAVAAPIPRARVPTTAAESSGFRMAVRTANRRSCIQPAIVILHRSVRDRERAHLRVSRSIVETSPKAWSAASRASSSSIPSTMSSRVRISR